MPDIAMCPGGTCHRKALCYRYTAEPSQYHQSYFAMVPVKSDGGCTYYLVQPGGRR